jgi:uncharacterized lipoprotein YmbA
MLSPAKPESSPDARNQELTVGVGPIKLPKYLQRQGIVSRSSENQLNVAQYHQWAEPLQENFSRVVQENLADMLSTERILILPVQRSIRKTVAIDYQVAISVSEFNKTASGGVILAARWAILDGDKQELLLRRSSYTETLAADDYAAQASAQSKALEKLCLDIAEAVRELEERDGS